MPVISFALVGCALVDIDRNGTQVDGRHRDLIDKIVPNERSIINNLLFIWVDDSLFANSEYMA